MYTFCIPPPQAFSFDSRTSSQNTLAKNLLLFCCFSCCFSCCCCYCYCCCCSSDRFLNWNPLSPFCFDRTHSNLILILFILVFVYSHRHKMNHRTSWKWQMYWSCQIKIGMIKKLIINNVIFFFYHSSFLYSPSHSTIAKLF